MSPLKNYFGGKGAKVMSAMKKTYGAKKARTVFYATANKKKKGESARYVAPGRMK